MSAKTPARRNHTARELAERFGVTDRTIRNVIAEPREEYEARARIRREKVVELRKQGKKYAEIAEELGTTTGAVGSAVREARKYGLLPPPASRQNKGQASA